MRRIVFVMLLTGALGIAVATAAPARRLTFTVKTRQGPTSMHAHPPSGAAGDTFDSSLQLVNAGIAQLGRPSHAIVGEMDFSYTIRRQCTSFRLACVATADFETVSSLPGGTLIAAGERISIAQPAIVIPVTGGTGRYRGARGTVSISPLSTKLSTFALVLAHG